MSAHFYLVPIALPTRWSCRNRSRPLVPWMCLLLLLASSFHPASAHDPDALLSQYGHTAWRVQDGALPGAAGAITQTQDGYLWVGTSAGLLRFDGVRFVPFSPPDGERLRSPEIVSLLAARDGSLWIGTTVGLAHWSAGRLTHVSDVVGSIQGIVAGEDQEIWFVRSRSADERGPLCRVSAALEARCFGKESGIPFRVATSLARSADGDLWIGSNTGVVRWNPTSQRIYSPMSSALSPDLLGVKALVPATDGSMWVGFAKQGPGLGLQRLVNERFETFEASGLVGDSLQVATLMVDSAQALWIGTVAGGIYRVRGTRVDRYSSADGLSSDGVAHFFEDREGNVWVATSRGLDRFRAMRVLTYSVREGLSNAGAVVAGRDGTVWINSFDSVVALRKDGMQSLQGGRELPGVQPTSMFEDREGRLWVGVDLDMTVLDSGRLRRIPGLDGRPIGTAVGITQDTSGDIWVLALANPTKLVRIRNFRAVQELAPPEIPRTGRVLADPKEGLWLGTREGDLAHLTERGLQTVKFHRDSLFAQVHQIAFSPEGAVLAATGSGVIGWRAGKSAILSRANGLPCDRITALVFDAHGALWLYAACGLIRIEAQELAKWWARSEAVVEHTLLDATDGAQGALSPFAPAAVRANDGRLWFVNGFAAQSVMPDRLPTNPVIPPVHIEALVADGQPQPLDGVRLPARTRDIAIQYTALSLVLPEKVLFRYRLEGHDEKWRDVDTRREVMFADLPPGTYRFTVIARNNDGVWNDVGASVAFVIPPMFYQTAWFRVVCLLGVAATVWGLFRLRLRQIKRGWQAQIEERILERERIARELHDTFLQSVQGLMLRFQSVLEMLPSGAPARQRMEDALDRADAVINEGRERIRMLRTPKELREDIAQSLHELIAELAVAADCDVRVTIDGDARGLHPVVADEVEGIAREALSNAFRHAQARWIEVRITYSRKAFAVRIVDDGCGFEWGDDARGKPGHWGLLGMHERAERIRARLSIVSRPAAGTTVELVVPAALAFGFGFRLARAPLCAEAAYAETK